MKEKETFEGQLAVSPGPKSPGRQERPAFRTAGMRCAQHEEMLVLDRHFWGGL